MKPSHQDQNSSKRTPTQISAAKMEHHAELLGNRVKKMYRHLRNRFKKAKIDCFRLYDWDIPEVRAVVDWYAGHVVIGEYTRTQTGSDWLPHMAQAVGRVLELPDTHIHLKKRRTKSSEGVRYKRMDAQNKRFQVQERDLNFWINPHDFLDTGLFSDHRDTRMIVRRMVKGKDFLNLYAYTGAFTCAAAAGGAQSSVSVDRSATYLAWARDNFTLNNMDSQKHILVQLDVDVFLKKALAEERRFDCALIDPPSFFKDAKAGRSFDINRDHPEMLERLLKIMKPKGDIFFSTNHQRFEPKLKDLPVESSKELTPKTIPEDYRNRTIHRCWHIKVK